MKHSNRKTLKTLKSLIVSLTTLFLISCNKPTPKNTIAILQIVEHQALDEVRYHFLETLSKHGLREGKNLKVIYRNAQGNSAINQQMTKDVLAANPDLILTISTPSAQAAVNATKNLNIPIVFAAVTDPVGAHLIKNLKTPEGNVTGILDAPPVEAQLDYLRKVIPHLKNLGLLYNPGETNSVAMINAAKVWAQKNSIHIEEGAITTTNDIKAVTDMILPKIDAIYVPLDNTIVSAMTSLSDLATHARKPVFAADSGSVKNGAVAALSYSYEDVGIEAGTMALKILEGTPIRDLPAHTPKNLKVFINKEKWQALKLP